MTDAAVQETSTGKSMVIDHGMRWRLARDHQRTTQTGLWVGGILTCWSTDSGCSR